MAVGDVDGIQGAFNFRRDAFPEFFVRLLQARLDHLRDLFGGEIGVAVLIVEDPAFALGDHVGAKFLDGKLVTPIAEGAFGELHNVALVNQRHYAALFFQGVLYGAANEALCGAGRHRLDADAGFGLDLLGGSFQHFKIQKIDHAFCVRGARAPFDSGVNILGVLAKDHDVHSFRIFYGRRHAFEVANRAHACIEVKDLTERHVERAYSAANGRGERAFDGHAEIANGFDCVFGQPVIELFEGFLAGKNFQPFNFALPAVGLGDGGIENLSRGFPDVAASAVAFDKGNYGGI